MEWRNAKRNADAVTFDCEVNHKRYGWIPFTASAADTEAAGRLLHAAILKSGAFTEPDEADFAEALRVKRQVMRAYKSAFRKALARMPMEGAPHALAAVDVWVAGLDQYDDRRIAWENVTIFERLNPDMALFKALGVDDAWLDDLFLLAMQIERNAEVETLL